MERPTTRLAKHLAHAGVASRRAAEEIIAAGRVTIDGETVTDPARGVTGAETIAVDGEVLAHRAPQRLVYAVHKPPGVVSTAHDPQGRRTVVDLLPGVSTRLYPVGRLDADTTGLILLTDDGELAHRLTHPSFEVPRTYHAKVRRISSGELEITIHEGRKRQVRRMCEAVGHPVAELERVAFGPLGLKGLQPGAHRRLTASEIERLRGAGRTRRGRR